VLEQLFSALQYRVSYKNKNIKIFAGKYGTFADVQNCKNARTPSNASH
jgi:hypothetical protein